MEQPDWLERFIQIYTELSADDLQALREIYHPNVEFIDPMHRIWGCDMLMRYFQTLYSNITSCQFHIDQMLRSDEEAGLYWTMSFQHKNLNRGRLIKVEGHSHLKVRDGVVIYHRDYLDAGAMVYEHIPLLGRVIRAIKHRAGAQ